MVISQIGVIGAGQMGNGIAHVMALAGYDVTIADISEGHLDSATRKIAQNLDRQITAKKISKSQGAKALEKIKTTVDLGKVAKTDLIIEAVNEDEELKRKIFRSLIPDLDQSTILASNTSSKPKDFWACSQAYPPGWSAKSSTEVLGYLYTSPFLDICAVQLKIHHF